jgi:hypothetical protein
MNSFIQILQTAMRILPIVIVSTLQNMLQQVGRLIQKMLIHTCIQKTVQQLRIVFAQILKAQVEEIVILKRIPRVPELPQVAQRISV